MKAMGIKTDQERVKTLLKDTITLLCKNGLSFKTKFSIEAVIGVTLDEDDVFLLSMNELVKAEGAVAANTDSPPEQRPSSRSAIDENTKHRRKRKRRHTKSEPGADSGKEHSSSDEDPARFEEDLSDGVSDDDQSSGQSSPKKRHEVNKQEPEDDDSSSKDIIYVKEEPRESWTENPGPSQHLESLPDFSQASFSQEPNFSMLPGLGEINNAEWPATTIGMLQNPPSSQRVSWQSGGLAAMDRMQPEQDGESSQQLDSSQMSENDHAFPCMVCGKSFSRRYSWKMHMNLHQGKYNIYCKICNKGFNNSYTLKGHMSNVHTGIKDFKCGICGKEFGYKHHLKSHFLRSHRLSAASLIVQSQSDLQTEFHSDSPPTANQQSSCDPEAIS